jgi:hypothetical protein
MNSKEIEKIENSLKRFGVSFTTKGKSLIIHCKSQDIHLQYVREMNLIEWEDLKDGVISKKITGPYRVKLAALRVSHIDSATGYIKIFDGDYTISISYKKPKQGSEFKIRPTLFFNPQSLKVIDSLIKSESFELDGVNQKQFCEKWNLSKPRLSNLMKAYKCGFLSELKLEIQNHPIDDYIKMMEEKKIKVKMKSFYESAKVFCIQEEALVRLKKELENEKSKIIMGPANVTTIYRERLRDEHKLELWCPLEQFNDLFRRFKLKPFKTAAANTAIVRISTFEDIETDKITNKGKLNHLRGIWELTYSEERDRNIRKEILKKYLQGETQ